MATIFSMLPLAMTLGSGAQLLQPLAMAVIGGVAVSMFLSLLVTPALFYLLRERSVSQQSTTRGLQTTSRCEVIGENVKFIAALAVIVGSLRGQDGNVVARESQG